MSPFLRQGTALAAILAVSNPGLGLAQQVIPADQIESHQAEMEADQPARARQLARQISEGMTANDLTCADTAVQQPCPDDMPLITPNGLAVVLGEDSTILLAPRPDQRAAQAIADAQIADDADDAGPAADTGAAQDADAKAADQVTADAKADGKGRPLWATRPGADSVAEDNDTGKDKVRDKPEPLVMQGAPDDNGQAGDAPAAPVADPDKSEAEPSAKAKPFTPADKTDASTEDALARSLAEAGADVETPPEAREESSDVAATRAAEAAAPNAAALETAAKADEDSEDADKGEDFESLIVTEKDARSSAQDFATSIAKATAPQEGQAASGTDTGRDLARAALVGLGAYVVGQSLGDQGQVALNSGDRVVITRQDGSQEVLKDDSALMFQPGARVETQRFDDGSSRNVVLREDGSRVITIRDADLRVLRRTVVRPDGSEVKLIDETVAVEPVDLSTLAPPAKPVTGADLSDEDALRRALEVEAAHDRGFTLGQIRAISGVRALVAPIDIDAITFDTGSAAINPDQARSLASLGRVIGEYVAANPNEVFLVEGYTDTVGTDAVNLALSDRRAESLALALTEYFDVPPENLVVQGYGRRFLKVPVEGDVRENRRVAVRRITDLLARN